MARHDTDGPGLVRERDALSDNPVHVGIFFVEVHAEMELEGSPGSGGVNRVADRDGRAQGVEGSVQATMVLFLSFGHQGRHVFKGGEDCHFFAIGVPGQDFIEEAEALDRCFESPSLPRAEASAAASMPSISRRKALWRPVIPSIGSINVSVLLRCSRLSRRLLAALRSLE